MMLWDRGDSLVVLGAKTQSLGTGGTPHAPQCSFSSIPPIPLQCAGLGGAVASRGGDVLWEVIPLLEASS